MTHDAQIVKSLVKSISIYNPNHFIETLNQVIAGPDKKLINYINQQSFVIARKYPKYFSNLLKSDYIYADGKPAAFLKTLTGIKCQRAPLTDMLLAILFYCNSGRIFILGAKPGVIEKTMNNLHSLYGHKITAQIVGFHHGYFKAEENNNIIEKINKSGANILLVCFGIPKQEQWVLDNFHALSTKAFLPGGGCIDFYTGEKKISRAPKIMQKLGLEWFFRFLLDPLRLFDRYFIGGIIFIKMVIAYFVSEIISYRF